MMPSASGSLDPGSIDVEAVDSIDGPRLRPTLSAGVRPTPHDRPGPDHRVRINALAAERDLIAAERERLDERVQSLAAEVSALEAEIEALEAEIEAEERQRQQVIDNYESIVRGRSDGDPDSSTGDATDSSERDATDSSQTGWTPLGPVASRVKRAAGWLRSSNG